jgi:DNA-binding response OmpR family regulator
MKRASILVTDDQSTIRFMVRTALESDGYMVREACNGKEALDAIKAEPPDLMVLDMNMPVLDGMAVLEHLKSVAAERAPRVIVLTAYGSIPAAVKATRLGAAEFLEKPVTPAELRRTVRSVLEEPELDRLAPGNVEVPGGYEQVVDRIRKSLRMAEFSDAEALLMKAADRREQHTAEYFNLLGVLYETQKKWRLARKCYGRAIDANGKYEPARANMRRLNDLQSEGRTSQAVVLGDEPLDVWFAQLPK